MEKKLEKLFRISKTGQSGFQYEEPSVYVEALKEAGERQIFELLMETQLIATFEDDIRLFFNDPVWNTAGNVLDIGCGTGHLIKCLKTFFPDKTYTGIDSKESSIAIARDLLAGAANCSLICKNIFDFSGGPFDYATARAVVQHLPSAEEFLKHARKLLKPSARLLILDAADYLDLESPKIPLLKEFYSKLAELQKKKGGNRAVREEIEKHCRSAGFRIEKCMAIPVSVASPPNKEIFVKRTLLASEFCRRLYGLVVDQGKLAAQLIEWADKTSSYAQHGYLQMVLV